MPPKAASASKSVKVPKKIPPWVAAFSEFSKTKERKREVQQSMELYSEILTKHWEAFVEHNQSEQTDRPAKKRAVDPIKSMGRAMEKVAERVEDAKDNQELLRQYQDRMKDVVPEQIKSVLSAAVGGNYNNGGDSAMDRSDVSRLIQEATDNLGVLSQATQRILNYANVNQPDADQAAQSLTQVSQSIENLKDSIGGM